MMSCGCKLQNGKTVRAVRWFYIALFGFVITYTIFYVATTKTDALAHGSQPQQEIAPHAEL